MNTIKYGCGCVVDTEPSLGFRRVTPCAEHGAFASVKLAQKILSDALREAHEQLPPGPEKAA